MHKKLFQIVFLCLFVILLDPSGLRAQGTQDFENEKELIKVADKHFQKEEFVSALSMYSQLASTYPKNHEYNYRYGICLLYGSNDKSSPIIFLNYAAEGAETSPKVYFYLAKSYHLSYRFDQAIKYYKLFGQKYFEKDFIEFETDRLIQQCETAKSMLDNIKEINVYEKKVLDDKEFFRAYRLEGFKGNILVVPVEIQSEYDIKKEFKTVTFHNPNYESIYFASKGKKGSGGSDIYRRNKLATGEWGEPIALGMNINTRYDENYPFLHPDGVTLYFCSKGHNSIGGYDVFRSKLDTNLNIWGKPENVGFAINSPGDDIMYVTDEFKNAAYFASNRENKQGEITIYKITSDKKSKRYRVVKGVMNQDGNPLANSEITVFDAKTNKVVGVYQSDFDGEYYITLPDDVDDIVYEVNIKGDQKVRQRVSGLSQEAYEQKIQIDSESLSMLVEESEPINLTSNDRVNALAQNSSLNVNQNQDINFNTKPINYEVKEGEVPEEKVEKSDFTATNTQIVDDAFADAESSLNEAEGIKKQLDVAYMIASDKNNKAKQLASEISALNKELEQSYDEEKAMSLSSKEAQLTKLKEEVLVTYNVAKNLEENLKNKEEEAEFAQKYAEDLKEAISSSSAEKAIDMLEATREELDKIYKKNEEAFSLEDVGEGNDEEISVLKTNSEDIGQEIDAIKEEKAAIIARAEEATEDFVKESILLEAEDLNEELASLENKKSKIDTELQTLQNEKEQFSSNQEIFDEIASAEVRDFSMEDIQKAEEAKTDLSEDVQIYENSSSTEEMVANLAEENNTDISITASSDNPSLEDINSQFEEIEDKEEVTPVEKLADISARVKMQERRLRSKQEELEILESTLTNESDLTVQSDIYKELTKLVKDTEEEVAKLNSLKSEYNNFNKSNDLNQTELTIEEANIESIVLNDSGELKDFDTFLEEVESENLATNDNSSEITDTESDDVEGLEENDLTTSTQDDEQNGSDISSDDSIAEGTHHLTGSEEVVNDELVILEDGYESESKENDYLASQENEALANSYEEGDNVSDDDISADPVLVTNEGDVSSEDSSDILNEDQEFSKEELLKLSFEELNDDQKLDKLAKGFDVDSSSNEDLLVALELIFGLKTNPDFEYGDNAIVQANVSNARRLERQAVNTYLLGVKRKDQADKEVKASKAKKGIEEALELQAESKNLQESASANYAVANREEYKYNKDIINGAIASSIIESNSEFESAMQNSDDLFNSAKELRSDLLSEFDRDERIELINQAYSKELSAIEIQAAYVRQLSQEEIASAESNQSQDQLSSGSSVSEEDATSQQDALNDQGQVDQETQDNQDDNISEESDENLVLTNVNSENPMNNEEETTSLVSSQGEIEGPQYDGNSAGPISKVNIEDIKGLTDEDLLATADESSVEAVSNTALELRASIANASPEDKERLSQQAALLEEMARTKRLKFVQKEYNDYLLMLKRNEELRRRMMIKDENSEALFLVGLVERDIQKQTEMLENGKEELELYSGEVQISAYQNALSQQQRIIDKQTMVLKTYADENPNVSLEDLAYVNALPDSIKTVGPRFVDVENNDSDILASNSSEEERDPSEDLSSGINNDKSDANRYESGSSTQSDDSDEYENQTEEPYSGEVVSADEAIEMVQNAQGNNGDYSQGTSVSNDGSNEEVTAVDGNIEDDAVVADNTEEEIRQQKELEDKLRTYAQMKSSALSDFESAEKSIEKAQILQKEAEELEAEADSKLKQTESAGTEEKIVALIGESDKLRLKANDKRLKANRFAAKADNDLASSKSKNQEAQDYILAQGLENDLSENDKLTIDYSDIQSSRSSIIETTASSSNDTALALNTEVDPTSTAVTRFESDYIVLNGSSKYSESTPIPIDPAMPEGLVFKVQVGAFRKEIPQDLFKGIAPLQGETTSQGFIRYTAGSFSGFEPANMAKREIRKMGYSDAFVVVYLNGKRISLGQAFATIDSEQGTERTKRANQVEKEIRELGAAGIGESYREPSIADLVQDINDTKGVMYTVQIGYYSESITPDKLFNLDPIYEDDNDGGYRYMHGIYSSLKEASARKTEVRNVGISDAFVIAYRDGNKISVAEANKLIDQGMATVDGSKDYRLDTSNSSNEGIVYKVQVGAYAQQVPLERAMIFVQFAEQGVEHFQNDNGLTIYSVGSLSSNQAAQSLKETIRQAGISDAFVTKYKNGKRL